MFTFRHFALCAACSALLPTVACSGDYGVGAIMIQSEPEFEESCEELETGERFEEVGLSTNAEGAPVLTWPDSVSAVAVGIDPVDDDGFPVGATAWSISARRAGPDTLGLSEPTNAIRSPVTLGVAPTAEPADTRVWVVDDSTLQPGQRYQAFVTVGCSIPDAGDGVTWDYLVRTATFTWGE